MGFCLEVTGDYACFTRPEMKVERVSYDVITPSAARAIFESILWKPAIKWQVSRIEVLKPIRWISIRRNEVSYIFPVNNIKKAMSGGKLPALYIDDIDKHGKLKYRQQRAGLFLRDVTYRIHAGFTMTDKAGDDDNAAKFAEMFRRRAGKGQCFHRPYLGCREFACDFRLIEQPEKESSAAINESRSLGWMFYDWDYAESDKDETNALFFNASMKDGMIDVPDRNSEEVRG